MGVSLGADDEARFSIRLLHFRRTFVEKMFAIHARVEMLKHDRRPLGPYARHYYDLYQLANETEVRAMLMSDECGAIRADYDKISRKHFSRSYAHPEEMRLSRSDALFPPPELATEIAREYERQCQVLCYGPFPSWAEVQQRFSELRDML